MGQYVSNEYLFLDDGERGQMRPINDPHVTDLHYWVEHDDSIDYDNAVPLDYEDDLMEVRLEKIQLALRPKEHYSTAQEAREAFDGFIRKWEFDAGVEAGTRQFELKYQDADIIDRNPKPPQPGVVTASAAPVRFRVEISKPRVTVGKPNYPSPPERPQLGSSNPMALAMLSRLDRYHLGRETLAAMSYFCLTVMWDSAKVAKGTTNAMNATEEHYTISAKVQRKVSYLSTRKGGNEARKGEGLQQDFTEDERKLLLAAVQAFTRRVAERAANPTAELKMITLADMPPLPKED